MVCWSWRASRDEVHVQEAVARPLVRSRHAIMTVPLEPRIRVGSVIADKYVVEKVLGQGGMGMVVAARHLGLNELRAIKFMLPAASADATAAERFRREAQAASRLKSEHVVRVYDIDRLATGEMYMVMEHLEGRDLRAVAKARGALRLQEACSYVLQACEAIAEAHGAGIVHRDLKTANLFVTQGLRGEPRIKVLDFGIAKLAPDDSTGRHELTQTKMALGTPAFMAPEQIRSSRQSDARVDIWSLGVILYKLTTGVLPFDAPNVNQLAIKILSPEPVRKPSTHNRSLPPPFDEVICKCLEKDRERRFGTVAELASSVSMFAQGGPGTLAVQTDDSHAVTLEMTTLVQRGSMPEGGAPPGGALSPAGIGAPPPDVSELPTMFMTPGVWEASDGLDEVPTPRLPKRP
ncbi:serine/threonine-protein kinase [Polyangium spumosum]|uniref:serine/threonine-protein kinase n=1 Tax=Polyangium spumosum TaxID=889282 RepID=UPI0014792C2D|nr:serine/threonine-protein kinase [Polyangium spumosum]